MGGNENQLVSCPWNKLKTWSAFIKNDALIFNSSYFRTHKTPPVVYLTKLLNIFIFRSIHTSDQIELVKKVCSYINQKWKNESNNSFVLESRINYWKIEHFCSSKQESQGLSQLITWAHKYHWSNLNLMPSWLQILVSFKKCK